MADSAIAVRRSTIELSHVRRQSRIKAILLVPMPMREAEIATFLYSPTGDLDAADRNCEDRFPSRI